METILFVIGGLVTLGGLAGFFISIWRPAPKADGSSDALTGTGSYTDHGQGDGH
jgi:hypothetical protein